MAERTKTAENQEQTALEKAVQVVEVAGDLVKGNVAVIPAAGMGGAAGGVGGAGVGAAIGMAVAGPPGAAIGYMAGLTAGAMGGAVAGGVGVKKVQKIIEEG